MSFLTRPQFLSWRKLLFQIHLWVGIGLGLYMFLMGVTGAALVFREEMQHAMHREIMNPVVSSSVTPDLVALRETLQREYPGSRVTGIYMPTEEHSSVAGFLRKEKENLAVYMDPASGAVLGTIDSEKSFLRWLQQLHFNLLSGRTGRIVNGVGGVFLLLLSLTGMVIWWPGMKRWRRSTVVDFRRKWKRVNWDLHSATGFWTLAILMLWAITGAYFTWPAEFRAAVNFFSPVSLAKAPAPDVANKGKYPPPDLRKLIAEAQQKSPNARLSGISFPNDDRGQVRVFMAREKVGDFDTSDQHYFDQFTGRHLMVVRRGLNASAGDVVVAWIAPLHFGTFAGDGTAGVAVKILWLLLGLAPPVLFVTGFLMYWNRSLSKKWARLKARQPERVDTAVAA